MTRKRKSYNERVEYICNDCNQATITDKRYETIGSFKALVGGHCTTCNKDVEVYGREIGRFTK